MFSSLIPAECTASSLCHVNCLHFIVVIMILIKIMIIMIIMIAIIIVVNNKSRLFEQVEKHLRQYGILLDDD